jgi:hypothetical protein
LLRQRKSWFSRSNAPRSIHSNRTTAKKYRLSPALEAREKTQIREIRGCLPWPSSLNHQPSTVFGLVRVPRISNIGGHLEYQPDENSD